MMLATADRTVSEESAKTSGSPLRILAVADQWQGSNAYAYVRAFRRMGHSVRVVPAEHYIPAFWQRRSLRALRRSLEWLLVKEYTEALIREARELKPHLFFVFKGRYVTIEAIRAIRGQGAVCFNFYPDVSFRAHGKYLPDALPGYDWIFTTKRFGLRDMEEQLGIRHASFLPHSFDPEVHRPLTLDSEDRRRYSCDVSFIGTWSPKKQEALEAVRKSLPNIHLRIWGSQWTAARPTLGDSIEGHHVLGLEFAKAICASKINLALLSEARLGSSEGDSITSRTFHIPATGSFMLHERTSELLEYYQEDRECGCFAGAEELTSKISDFLENVEDRERIASAGRQRAVSSGYGVDSKAESILAEYCRIAKSKRK